MNPSPTSLAPGDRLGRYEIVALLGAGGMGEVYRAHDPQLHRDVALKVLRRSSATPDEIARFGREARAAGGLNHPNIVVVYDVGIEAGTPYVVTELLEGETLRARLDRGPIPFLKAVDYGTQIAAALGAAHARSIWHRDVKPANVFISNDGRVKLLDFGIAKLGEKHLRANANDPTEEVSDRHSVFGTAGYMSPEQVLGHPADHRSDIFAFGAVLYELFTRTRAFRRDSTVQTMNAVLQDDPPDPLSLKPDLPPMAVAIVRRCLEKNKEERFQSARDLAFDLLQLRDTTARSRPLPLPPAMWRRTVLRALAAVAVLAAAVAAGWLLAPTAASPTFELLTFKRARISGARFVGDDRAVVYSESHDGKALQLWRIDIGQGPPTPPTRPLEYADGTDILAARAGELALSLNRRFLNGDRFVGVLATAPLGGGAPRPVEANVEDADWDDDGAAMAIVRSSGMGGRSVLEYPIRNQLHESPGSISFARVSPDRRYVAFIEDAAGGAEGGQVAVVNISSRAVTVLSPGWKSVRGLAWSPNGDEIWFTAGQSRSNRDLWAVTIAGNQRLLMPAPGSLTLWDVARDGRVLMSRDDERRSLIGVAPGDTVERDLSWFDDSGLADVSDDGKQLLFSDRFGVHVRSVDGALPIRFPLTDVYVDDLSPDGTKILATTRDTKRLLILSTGPGGEQQIPAHTIVNYRGAKWLPGGNRVIFAGAEAGRNLRAYVQDLNGGQPTAITPEHMWALAVSPLGDLAAVISDTEPGVWLWPIDGKEPARPVPGTQEDDRPVAFSSDGRALWMFKRSEVPGQVIRLDIATGKREAWRTLTARDVAGAYSITEFAITPDGAAYFYSLKSRLSQLYLVGGIR